MNDQTAMSALPLLAGVAGTAAGGPAGGMAASAATGAVVGGIQANQAAGEEKEQLKNQAELESINSEQQANEIRRQMASTLGSQTAMLASRGVALGAGGVAEQLAAEATGRFEADLRTNRLNALTGASVNKFQQRQTTKAGQAAMIKGVTEAATLGYGFAKAKQDTGSTGMLPGNAGNATKPFVKRSSMAGRGA
jgi:hypothetical protein